MLPRNTLSLFGTIHDHIVQLDNYLWIITLIFISIFGVYATIRLKAPQITHLPHAVKLALDDIHDQDPKGKISSFEAFCISMGARIGVGNIAGTAAAIMTPDFVRVSPASNVFMPGCRCPK